MFGYTIKIRATNAKNYTIRKDLLGKEQIV